jgi:hypothetical protein
LTSFMRASSLSLFQRSPDGVETAYRTTWK